MKRTVLITALSLAAALSACLVSGCEGEKAPNEISGGTIIKQPESPESSMSEKLPENPESENSQPEAPATDSTAPSEKSEEYIAPAWDGGEWLINCENAMNKAETVEELLQTLTELDVYNKIDYVHVYAGRESYNLGAEPLTEGSLAAGGFVYMVYDSGQSWMEHTIRHT